MRALIVLSVDVPDPENLPEVIRHINPPGVPYFEGEQRVAIDPPATHVLDYLEGRTDVLPAADQDRSAFDAVGEALKNVDG